MRSDNQRRRHLQAHLVDIWVPAHCVTGDATDTLDQVEDTGRVADFLEKLRETER